MAVEIVYIPCTRRVHQDEMMFRDKELSQKRQAAFEAAIEEAKAELNVFLMDAWRIKAQQLLTDESGTTLMILLFKPDKLLDREHPMSTSVLDVVFELTDAAKDALK